MVSKRVKACFIAGCILLAAISNAGLQIWWDYQETFRRQETTVRDVSRVVNAQIDNRVRQAEAILGLLANMIQEDNGLVFIRESSRWKKLRAYCDGLTGCKSIAVIDPVGRIVALSDVPDSPIIDASDRVYFRVTKETRKLFVGPAAISRIRGNPILFFIARPAFDSSGKLLAIISAGMTTSHLTEFYGLLGFAVNPTISVFKGNGDLVASNPDMARYVGRNFANGLLFAEQLPKAPSGVYLSYSVVDGTRRIASYQTNKELDLIVFAGIEVDVALHEWKVRAWRTGITSAIALVVIFLALYRGYLSLESVLNLRAKNIELDRISNVDVLTGIANRRFFEMALGREWGRHQEEKRPFSLLLIDIDCFKQFNDRHGHQAGDDCLRKVAAALQSALLRNVDIVARYGGEEFAVILDADQNGAISVGERMRVATEALAIPHSGSSVGPVVTISVGVASIPENNARTPIELIGAADKALYNAKENGRNQVAVCAVNKSAGS